MTSHTSLLSPAFPLPWRLPDFCQKIVNAVLGLKPCAWFRKSPSTSRFRVLDARPGRFAAFFLGAACLASLAGILLAHWLEPRPAHTHIVSMPISVDILSPEQARMGENSRRNTGDSFLHLAPYYEGRASLAPSTPSWSAALASPPETVKQPHGLMDIIRGKVIFATTDGLVNIERLREAGPAALSSFVDPLHIDMFSRAAPALGVSLIHGEALDAAGRPLRWETGNPLPLVELKKECRLSGFRGMDAIKRLILGVGLAPSVAPKAQAEKYRALVHQYARKYNLTPGLILAIMHTESNFNPLAVSSSNALGLMQIVRESAGNEVYRYLTGTPGTPSVQALLSPESNILYGVTYLHLLGNRYFGNVLDQAAREICIIAAYNGGPGAVLRVFDPEPEIAVARINALTAKEVYSILTSKMPSAESRRYVDLVLGQVRNYSVF